MSQKKNRSKRSRASAGTRNAGKRAGASGKNRRSGKRSRARNKGRRWRVLAVVLVVLLAFLLTFNPGTITTLPSVSELASNLLSSTSSNAVSVDSLGDIPEYDESPYVAIDADSTHADGVPSFTEEELERAQEGTFEDYSELDSLGRCGAALACVGEETMPTEERGDISDVYPTGWNQEEYDFVDGGVLYNRCHLVAFSLAGENDNELNLITGTRYLNVEGMLPFEEQILNYIEETGNHVLYRVTPIFEEDELLARGVHLEAWSVEDDGEGVCFNVYCYNVQPGVSIDYATGENEAA